MEVYNLISHQIMTNSKLTERTKYIYNLIHTIERDLYAYRGVMDIITGDDWQIYNSTI